ncbi:MAG: endonuclease III [Holosporaceae bacterium]|jgi:endonuclease-3|nr:endonuclease III [Holosporaceae bacterium]
MCDERVEEICRRLTISLGNPHSELTYTSDYMFVVAVVLSAQTTDVQVNRVTSNLFRERRTPDDILKLGLDGLTREIHSIGLYRNKAKHIIALSQMLKEKFNSLIPSSREDLESLPGVGRKSANVIMNILFHCPTIAVDTHVLRLSQRLGLSQKKDPLGVEKDLEKIIPRIYKQDVGNLLVLHGRYICKARKPECSRCVLRDLCQVNS